MLDANATQRLADSGISTHHGANFHIADDCVFEPPCSIKWMNIQYRLRMGAFSYAVSGYYFDAVIGRYVSIGEQVQIGRGSHPVSWASTSPMFYQDVAAVLDLSWPQAAGTRFEFPPVLAQPTVIGHDVYIGHGAFIMQGVKIGNGAIVGACAVVTRDVAPYTVVAGSPAVVKKSRFSDALIDRMEAVAWWRYPVWEMSGAPVADPGLFLDFVAQRIDAGMSPYGPKTVSLSDIMCPDDC